MWVADVARGLGVGRRILAELEATRASAASASPAGDEPVAARGDRPLSIGRVRRGRARSTTSRTRTTGSRSACRRNIPNTRSPFRGVRMALTLGDTAPTSRRDTTEGRDQLPRLDWRLVGRAVLAPRAFDAGLHDRTRLHGVDQAGVRQARREDHRHLDRPGRGHREWSTDIGDTRHRDELPDHRR